MKKAIIVAVGLLAASAFAQDKVIINKQFIRTPNGSDVTLNVVKNPDGTYSLVTSNVIAVGTGTDRTWTLQTGITTASGSIAAGANSISISPSSDFVGTINGASITGTTNGASFNPHVNAPDILPAVAYTRSAGSLTISVIR